ncbi:unnamed protein product [Aspergillus oryzae RIB40]|uniref:DNA, SC038 n=2 Tax=Aspergillus oryzae TaxID=5062 RepID=Q2U2K5_ASPOR|nr:unnamed protein product [Aspergillus oryzae RIB40]OOO09087.1 hypothetical protein OAory_01103830 [Aspergillus oryzae]BAE64210.1 unnamed protein product [Aspergillus oryzae RIB40]
MKFQTLCSLATLGLAFANPIQNRGQDFTDCVTGVVKKGVTQGCATLPKACGVLDEFTACTTDATAQVTDITDLDQRRSEWLASLNSCGQTLWDGLKNAGVSEVELNTLQVSFLEMTSESLTSCSKSA